ncbi:hypothetical protein KO361_04090 [Candidatus Woesearchaeota archaeon]|nr:hypothetical protein [Candidatus Woesearchaeota archaeon]
MSSEISELISEPITTEKQEEKEKSYSGKILLTIALALLLNTGYHISRPTTRVEVIGGKFSNKDLTELYVKDIINGKQDTLYFNTTNKFKILLGHAESYQNQAEQLKQKLTPGKIIDVKLYNKEEKKVYSIDNIRTNHHANIGDLVKF